MGISSFAPGASHADMREALSRDGAFVLSGVLDRERLAAVREAVRPLITNAALGTNSFDGFKTRRVFVKSSTETLRSTRCPLTSPR